MAFICTFLIGIVFLFSGLIKSLYLQPFINHIQKLRLFPKKANVLIALFFVELECGLGISMILHVYPRELIPFTFFLVIWLSVFNFWANRSGRAADCGCYGSLITLAPWQTLSINSLYLVILAAGWFTRIEDYTTVMWKVWIVIFSILICGYLAKRSVDSPLVDFSKLKTGTQWQNKWVTSDDLGSGACLAVFLSNECSICKDWIAEIETLNLSDFKPSLIYILPNKPDINQFLQTEFKVQIPQYLIKPRLFNSLIYQTPTAVLIDNGTVLEKWVTGFPDILRDV